MMLYGHGDGGGGPDKMMHERIDRLGRMRSDTGLPRLEHSTPDRFFDELAAQAVQRPAARWVGELYLELHQGTFTSQAKTKRNNREGERALKDIELFATAVRLLGVSAYDYPVAELRQLWEGLLLHQFQ